MKSDYKICEIGKNECKDLLNNYHYLSNISKGFKSGVNFGLFLTDKIVGVCIFTGFPVPELAKGAFGLGRDEQDGLFELSRLCLSPDVQKSEHNIASWFVSRSIKKLKKLKTVRAILSYADDDYHSGTVYAACNFKYYGLTAAKKDFYIKKDDGYFVKHSRGKVSGLDGEWRLRSRKHRFMITVDDRLIIKWELKSWLRNKDIEKC